MTHQRPLADAVCRGCRDSVHKIFQRRGGVEKHRFSFQLFNFSSKKAGGGGGAARMRACHRRSGGGVTCKLHVAAHAACQASQSDSRSLPLPCHHALAALQPQTACQAASLTDLQAAAARALFKPRGLAMSRQDCNSTTRPFAWSAELRYRANFNRITAGGPLGMLHLPVPHCSMSTPTTAPPAPLGNLQSLQLHDHTATLVRSVRVI